MNERIITVKGHPYKRSIEMIGEVEKVTWYNTKMSGYSEINDEEDLKELENAYEAICMYEITPPLPII